MAFPDDKAYRYLYNDNGEKIIRVGIGFNRLGNYKTPYILLTSEKHNMNKD